MTSLLLLTEIVILTNSLSEIIKVIRIILKNSEVEKSIKTTSQTESEDETHQDLDSDSESNSVKMSSSLSNHYKTVNINKSLPALSSKNESTALNLVNQNMITASYK